MPPPTRPGVSHTSVGGSFAADAARLQRQLALLRRDGIELFRDDLLRLRAEADSLAYSDTRGGFE